MANPPQSLEKLLNYTLQAQEACGSPEDIDVDEDYEARINKTLQSLQNQVQEHELALEKLRARSSIAAFDAPSQDPKSRLKQLHTITAAYECLASTEPELPLPTSPLPALIALRSTLKVVDQTKKLIGENTDAIVKARARLYQEKDGLKDAQETTQALEKQIEKLKTEKLDVSQKSPEDFAKTLVQAQQQARRHHIAGTRKLVEAFNVFVYEYLAAMVAAEDLGGPVVGDIINIDQETLRLGFTKHGRVKKSRGVNDETDPNRKRRNEEIWDFEDSEAEGVSRDEKEAAAATFRSLTEDLLNAAADEDDSNPYIEIPRESAAVKFLVRAKIAQFHPDDARKLRLLDFGKALDDYAKKPDMRT